MPQLASRLITHRIVEIHCLIDGCLLGVATMVSIRRAVSLGL